jgi:hypothetical protein
VRFAGYRSTGGTTATGRGRRGPRPPEPQRRGRAAVRRRRLGRRHRRDTRAQVVFAPDADGAWRCWRCSAPPRATRRLPGGHHGCAREAAAAATPRPHSRARRRRSRRTCDQVPCGENLADAPGVVKRERTYTIEPGKRRGTRVQVDVAFVPTSVSASRSSGTRVGSRRPIVVRLGRPRRSRSVRCRPPTGPRSRAGGRGAACGVAAPFVSRRAQRDFRGRVPRLAKRRCRGVREAAWREVRRARPRSVEGRDLELVQRAAREVVVRPGRVWMRCRKRGAPPRSSVTVQLVGLPAVSPGEALREGFVEEMWHRLAFSAGTRRADGGGGGVVATEKRKPSWVRPGWLRRTYRDRRSFGVGSRPNP